MASDGYWWELPLVVNLDNAVCEYTTRELLCNAADYELVGEKYNGWAGPLDVFSVDFNDDDEFNWAVSVPSNGNPHILLIKNAPEDWDIPGFANSVLMEWSGSDNPDLTYLLVLPPPATAFMKLEEFWADQILPHSDEIDDLFAHRVVTRHGWATMDLQYLDAWINSIDADHQVIEEEDGYDVIQYRSEPEPSVPVLPFLTA
ncbi:uncharacterized protein GGS22DRAFT_164328 [Annulohypoxylon maeteangense]|uniref:uncharacterized protein n=1 Tax=Annulohypoxylon maeteangense TaxID=1927788 RepID=UPI00200727A6|nr:uncharacterized protein GGS22DRAFT_164328 [Annulohypoxylon maeteangense]KAI0884778.1 hypothetical protein GGS22DRAFT_164328 [Annulohypoxylon maeteangense]